MPDKIFKVSSSSKRCSRNVKFSADSNIMYQNSQRYGNLRDIFIEIIENMSNERAASWKRTAWSPRFRNRRTSILKSCRTRPAPNSTSLRFYCWKSVCRAQNALSPMKMRGRGSKEYQHISTLFHESFGIPEYQHFQHALPNSGLEASCKACSRAVSAAAGNRNYQTHARTPRGLRADFFEPRRSFEAFSA